jgi:hypothetical protein
MNLIFNKPFLENASNVFDVFLKATHRKSESNVKIYLDAINGDDLSTASSQYVLFAPASFVTIMDKINSAFWNESFSLATDGERVKILVNTFLNGNASQRNSALDKLVAMGILASGDVTSTKAIASRIPEFDPDLVVKEYNEEENFYKYSYNIPLELETKYDEVRNTDSEKLFMYFPARGHSQFAYSPVSGEDFGYFAKYWNMLFQKDSFATGYVAVDLGDITSSDEEAVKYDHLDKIEYFDNIIIQISIPNKYS